MKGHLQLVLLLLAYQAVRPGEPPESGFDGFQPVTELQPRLIRGPYETN